MMKQTKTIRVDSATHANLCVLAHRLTERTGRRHSLADIVREARRALALIEQRREVARWRSS